MNSKTEKYKDQVPIKTINQIRSILGELGILTREKWFNSLEDFYSLTIKIVETKLRTNGKGTTPEYALASGYGEFMERLQNQLLYPDTNIDKEVKNYKNFVYAPDEKQLTIKEILNSKFDLFSDQIPVNKKKKYLKKVSFLDSEISEDKLNTVPFYNLEADQLYYLPIRLVEICYGTNGMCAGNTPEEALVQGISEILERYVNRVIIEEKIVPPTIPEDYLKKFPQLYKRIKQIKQVGKYRVIIKDCSLNKEFPVVGLILIDTDTQRYFVKFGAHPVFKMALERTLTELLQGKKLKADEKLEGLMEFSYLQEDVQTRENLNSIFANGAGYYPPEFFGRQFSYQFSEFEDRKKLGNKQLLQYLINFLHNNEYQVLVRDVSFLDFPSFQVIIPGMSEIIPLDFKGLKRIEKENWAAKVKSIMRRFPNVKEEELMAVVRYLKKQGFTNTNSIADIFGKELKDSFPWHRLKTDLFIAAIYYKLKMFKKSYERIDQFVNDIEDKTSEATIYYKCVRDYIGAQADKLDKEKIRAILTTIYNNRLVKKVIKDMEDPEEVFDNYGFLNCWDCGQCIFKEHCSYQQIREIQMKLKEHYSKNPINQMKVSKIFDF